MAFEYHIDDEHPIVHVRVWGMLELDDHTNYTRRILADPDVPHGYVEIVSFLDVTDFAIAFSDFPGFRDEFERLKRQKNQIGTVLVIPSQYHYGMGRVIERMAGDTAQFEYTEGLDEARRIALKMLTDAAPGAARSDAAAS